MRLKPTLIFLLTLFVLTGCIATSRTITLEEQQNLHSPDDEQECDIVVEVIAVPELTAPLPFTVLYAGENMTRAMYEPAIGTYVGAWLWQGLGKLDFEAMIEKKHAVFAMEMMLGDEFPATWILQSIAAQAAPLIVLRLPDTAADDFPLTELTMFAHELGRYNLPSFIVFNPLPPGPGMSPEDYVLLFRYARIIFRTYAPMAAFVWHSNNNQSTPESPFYPGHDAVDWVSISITAPQGPEGFINDIPAQLAPFYVNFQEYKPIMLLPIGISHFSRRDYVYRVPEAAAEIMRVYEAIRNGFPRVRLIVYANHGITTPQGDDFSITREQGTIDAYRNAIADSHFLSMLEPGGEEGPVWMLSAYQGYYYSGQIFVDREMLTARQQRIPSTAFSTINGRSHVEIGAIPGLMFEVDYARRVIWLTK